MPRLASGNQTMDRVEEVGHVGASDCFAAHIDQLVLDFIALELTEPPPAQLAKIIGDGTWAQFIRKTFNDNPVLEQLARYVVPKRLDTTMQRNSPHRHENFDESTRLLHLVNEVLEGRNCSSQNIGGQTKQCRSMRAQSTHNVLQQLMKPTNISGHCENCNLHGLVSQHKRELIKAPSNVDTSPTARQELQDFLSSRIIENQTADGVTMSVKIYIPSPPPEVKCSYVGRIIGPNGTTIRKLQRETGCQIAIRGRGSVKDSRLFHKFLRRPGFEHLKEDTHVLIKAESPSRAECSYLIENAKKRILEMFTSTYHALKSEQFNHLAARNGYDRRNFSWPRQH